MLNDIDVLRQMYATLCGSIDDALTLLEWGNVWDAKKIFSGDWKSPKNFTLPETRLRTIWRNSGSADRLWFLGPAIFFTRAAFRSCFLEENGVY